MAAKIKLTVILALMALIFAMAGGVLAQEPPPDLDDPEVVERLVAKVAQAEDREQVFNQLSLAEREAVQEFVSERIDDNLLIHIQRISPPGDSVQGSSSNSGCATQKITYVWEMTILVALKIDVLKLHSDTRWCWNGSQITSDPEIRIRGTVHWPYWEYVGNVNQNSGGGRGHWEHWDYVQAHFRLCQDDSCSDHRYPSITKRQYGDGTSTESATH